MKRKINIALVGSGAMGRAHSAAVANLRYCYKNLPFEPVLHTLVTGDPEKAPEKASELGFKCYTDSLEKAVSDENIDVVDICTPNMCHYEQVKTALENGKNVLCEKPLAVNASQAKELEMLAGKSGKICGVVFNNRHVSGSNQGKTAGFRRKTRKNYFFPQCLPPLLIDRSAKAGRLETK